MGAVVVMLASHLPFVCLCHRRSARGRAHSLGGVTEVCPVYGLHTQLWDASLAWVQGLSIFCHFVYLFKLWQFQTRLMRGSDYNIRVLFAKPGRC
jgi:hypothetical protein